MSRCKIAEDVVRGVSSELAISVPGAGADRQKNRLFATRINPACRICMHAIPIEIHCKAGSAFAQHEYNSGTVTSEQFR